MKLSIQKADLQRGLGRIQAIVERRNSMPILANVLLDASKEDGGSLLIAATDLEVGIRSSQDASVAKPGALTVSARKLYDIVRELPDEPVTLQATANSYLEIAVRARSLLAGRCLRGGVPEPARVPVGPPRAPSGGRALRA